LKKRGEVKKLSRVGFFLTTGTDRHELQPAVSRYDAAMFDRHVFDSNRLAAATRVAAVEI